MLDARFLGQSAVSHEPVFTGTSIFTKIFDCERFENTSCRMGVSSCRNGKSETYDVEAASMWYADPAGDRKP
jgi:hypothetical protein